MIVPPRARRIAQPRAHPLVEGDACIRLLWNQSEQLQKAAMIEDGERRQLELDERQLPRIDIDGHDAPWLQQQKIQNVVAGAGDDEQVVIRLRLETALEEQVIFPDRRVAKLARGENAGDI